MRSWSATFAIFGSMLFAVPESFAQTWFQPWLGIEAEMTTAQCTQQVGGRCALVCPASDGQSGSVEGTDTYSSYSSICAAAIHAGVLAPGQAGAVVIVVGAGEKSYRGSARNGVTSHSYGPRAGSFTFAMDSPPGTISWQTAWSHMPAEFTDRVTVTCPRAGDTTGKVWGTDVYTVESAICVAAVHAGVITAANGGAVTVQRAPGLRQYAATERFGIASRGAAANPDAFAVMAARATSPPAQPPPSQPPPPPPGGLSPRTIALAGFTGIGSASQSAPIAPRTIALAGFTGIGSAPTRALIGPRTIPAPGWTGVGSAP